MQVLDAVIGTIADDFVRLQHHLDAASFDRLSKYAQLWRVMHPVTPEIADALIPSMQAMPQADVTVQMAVTRSLAREAAVELSILNLGYATKFQHTDLSSCTIQVRLRRDDSNSRRFTNG